MWKSPDDLAGQSQKRTEDMSRSAELDILNSPPLSLTDLSTGAGLANWTPVSAGDADASGPEQDTKPSLSFRNRLLDELPSRRPADISVSAEVRLVIVVLDVVAVTLSFPLCPDGEGACSSSSSSLSVYLRRPSATGRRSVQA